MSDTKQPSGRSASLEHAPHATRQEAERLLTAAGSQDQAKRAVESATGQRTEPKDKDPFARQWKFSSYLEMFEASKPLSTSDGKHWFATNVGPDQWIVWNEEELSLATTVRSVDEAQAFVGAKSAPKQADDRAPPTG